MPYVGLLPKSGCKWVVPFGFISAMYCAEFASSGYPLISVFQGLSAGNIWQPPIEGTFDAAVAVGLGAGDAVWAAVDVGAEVGVFVGAFVGALVAGGVVAPDAGAVVAAGCVGTAAGPPPPPLHA